MRGLRGTPPALPAPFSPSPPALGSLAVFFPCSLRSRPRRPLLGASETARDRCSEPRIPEDAARRAAGTDCPGCREWGWGGIWSGGHGEEGRGELHGILSPTACPEGPGKSRQLRPAWEILGCSRLAFPSSYSSKSCER